MKRLNLHEIRKEFLGFFQEKEHLIAKSFPLIPRNDKSLLLINAGMAPLKNYFLGNEEPPNRRMSTCQKCIRTGDIENVGKTDRHGTFFEMLGNFSFGNYFKEKAIEWAWEFMTKRMEVPEDKIWVSVYHDDDEAYKIWNEIVGVPKEKIVKLGKEDNFWELEVGPCGPCSEIHIDRGERYGCGKEDCKPGCECDRYTEVWNLVFSQYDKDEEGNYNPLPKPNIDTGMGLERMTIVLNEANNIFEIEPINIILKEVEKLSGTKYGEEYKKDVSIRIITDHARAMTFMICDGIMPSNEGRGYVLRRLIRRAARHGKLLGINKDFLYELTNVVIENWKKEYPELQEREQQIKKVIKVEEEKFQETIDQGMDILKGYIDEFKNAGKNILDGDKAFKLYDTYGFPLDLTKEILEEQDYQIDEEGFNEEMEKQRDRARKARVEGNNQAWNTDAYLSITNNIKTKFEGYNNLTLDSKVLMIIKGEEEAESLESNEEGIIILDRTPFYAEGGGQIGDKGIISNENLNGEVYTTKKMTGNKIIHYVRIKNGRLTKGDAIETKVDLSLRMDTSRNHTATHLLHKALKEVVGEHVNQAGSLVTDDRLRFDFTHFEGLNNEQINTVEELVNDKILKGLELSVLETSMDEAKKIGATALFDEKYGDKVRVVKLGDFSIELCGGTHVNNTSEIGLFKILSETGIASGVRRIEAVTGRKVYEILKIMEGQINEVVSVLKANKNDVVDKVKILNEEAKRLEKEVEKLKAKLASSKLDDILNEVYNVEGINIIIKRIDGMDMNSLRQLGDQIKDKLEDVVVILAAVKDEKVNFMATTTKNLTKKGIHCGKIIKDVAKVTGGGGGGRPDMAQAGGKDSSKVDEALSIVINIVKEQLS